MRVPIQRELLDKGLITEDQFQKIDAIVSGRIVSVFYELRTMLYLGVLLFSAGFGILIYQNIGEIGHLVAIATLTALMLGCFSYGFARGPGYSNGAVKGPTPYFDYIILLGSLLFISVLGYLQFQYALLTENLGFTSLVTAAFFFFMAYRFDHLGVLSLAITALASFWGISLSPQKWYSSEFFSGEHLYNTAIVFSAGLGTISMILDRRSIKQHFTFTYLNFCSLMFFIGTIVGVFIDPQWWLYLFLIGTGSYFAFNVARWKKSFLFLLYAFVAGYLGLTSLLARTILDSAPELWFFYSLGSCGAFIYFIIKYRNHFSRN